MNFLILMIKILWKPTTEFQKIKTQKLNYQQLIFFYLFPLIFLGSFSIFLGSIFFQHFPMKIALIRGIIFFVSSFLAIFISYFLIRTIFSILELKTDNFLIFKWLTFSTTIIFLSFAVANLSISIGTFAITSIFSIYTFWVGAREFFQLQTDKLIFVVLGAIFLFLGAEMILLSNLTNFFF